MPARLDGLDRLRGAALVLMLVHHLIGWYGAGARDIVPGWDGFALTDVAAPAFTITLGASVPLLLASRRRRGRSGVELVVIVLRRYGLLVPIGLGLRAAIGFELDHTGVLETLGLSALVVAAVVAVSTPARRLVVGAAVLLVAPAVERAAADRTDWLSSHVLSGTFPLVTYVGLALLGACAVDALRTGPHRTAAAVLTTVGIGATLWLVAIGEVPDRYPGDASYLVPGITGTLLLYLLVSSPRLDEASVGGRLLQRAGAHTFGVFIAHYGIYVALRETGNLHALSPAPAVVAAIATTAVFVWLAPQVPAPPWTPRAGWRRPRASTGAASTARRLTPVG